MSGPKFLPPGVTAETFTYSDGRTTTIYRAQYPSEGPVRFQDSEGNNVLAFLYAAFVFEWTEGSGCVRIGMGTLKRYSRNWSQPICGVFSKRVLAEFGQKWARHHMTKFQR